MLNRNQFSFISKFSKILQQLANQYSLQQHDQHLTQNMFLFIFEFKADQMGET